MPKIKVTAVLDLAALLGGREREIDMPEGSRIGDLLEQLVAERGQPLADRLFLKESRELRKDLHLFLNGRHVYFLNGPDTLLQDGDVLLLLPPAGGG